MKLVDMASVDTYGESSRIFKTFQASMCQRAPYMNLFRKWVS